MGRLILRTSVAAEPPPSGDATLWVNSATGDDSRSKATVAASGGTLPWATVGRAMRGSTTWASPNTSEAAAAGDIVEIANGTYTEAGHLGAGEATFFPANSGTSGNPIIFRAATPGGVRLALSSTGTHIGNRDESYIEFDGFEFDDTADSAFTSGGTCYLINGGSVTFRNCIFRGDTVSGPPDGNNYAGVFTSNCSGTDGVKFINCLFEDYGDGADNDDENHCGVDIYNHTSPLLFEYCTFRRCGSGIYYKANNQDTVAIDGITTVRYCLFEDCAHGFLQHRSRHNATYPLRVYQNLFIDCSFTGIEVLGYDEDGSDPGYGYFVNNTLINCSSTDGAAIALLGPHTNANFLFQNNIVSGGACGLKWGQSADGISSDLATYVRNQINGQSSSACAIDFSNITHAAWAATSGLSDTNSITSAPTFVNAAGGNYRLASNGQAALTQGRVPAVYNGILGTTGDTIPLGAYITGSETIGYT